jgi:ERCC4-type nuclease
MNIDFRESDFMEAFEFVKKTFPNFNDIQMTKKNLEIGDIEFPDYGIIIERKTLNDLASSIKDGRYSEQSHRLVNSPIHNHSIYYLIEGDITKRSDKTMLYSAMVSLQHFKGFSVIRVSNINESVYFLCNMLVKLKKENKPGFYQKTLENISEEETDKQYTSFVKKQKKANITKNNIHEIMLMQVPGISDTIARGILKEFGTIQNLIHVIQNDIDKIKLLCLLDKNGKSKKLSKTVIQNLTFYFEVNTE